MKLNDIVNASREFLTQGRKFQQEGELESAIAAYQRAIDLDPDCDQAHHFLGEVYVRQDRLKAGVKSFFQAIDLNPHNHWTHHCLGQALSWLGSLDEAISCAISALQLQPEQSEFAAQLGLYLELKGDAAQAIEYYQMAFKLNPQQPETVYSSLMVLMWDCGKIQEVLPYCRTAVELYPQSAALHFTQGKILASQQLFVDAAMSYSQAVALQPNYWQAYEALSQVYLKLDLTAQAREAEQNAETAFYQLPEFERAALPEDFDWEIYLAFNSELNVNSQLEAIAHFLLYGLKENKLYALKHLHDPVKKPDIVSLSTIPLDADLVEAPGSKLAVLVHIYYFDLWSELSGYIQNITSEFDLYVNIVASIWQPPMHKLIRQDFPNARIIISANRGKDVGGHLASMRHLDFSQYDTMCLLHTKKSPHIDERIANVWRRDLYDALLGTPAKVQENINLMQHSQIGLIGSRFWRCTMMGNNWENYNRLLQEFKIAPSAQNCEYVSGTMMFVRASIMETIYQHFRDVELENGDEQSLDFHIDGQVAHALERIIGNLVRDRNLVMFWQE